MQSFARKLIRLDALDVSAVRNEIRAMTKLCDGSNENIIEVIRTGDFEDLSYAYIDMELCDLNLEEYIRSKWALQPVEGAPSELDIWDIMSQISSGIAFVHAKNEIHRDLKPSNGMLLGLCELTREYYSPFETKSGS
jgi:serine/threonine protein kinase